MVNLPEPSAKSRIIMSRIRARRASAAQSSCVVDPTIDARIREQLKIAPVLRDPINDDAWSDECTAEDFGRG